MAAIPPELLDLFHGPPSRTSLFEPQGQIVTFPMWIERRPPGTTGLRNDHEHFTRPAWSPYVDPRQEALADGYELLLRSLCELDLDLQEAHGKLFRARAGEAVSWKVSYGYRRVPRAPGSPGHHVIFEPEAAVARRIFNDYVAGGLSVRRIVWRLHDDGIPSDSRRCSGGTPCSRPSRRWAAWPRPATSSATSTTNACAGGC